MSDQLILERVKIQHPQADDVLVNDFITTVKDRIRFRLLPLEPVVFPEQLNSIVVSVVVAMVNEAELNHQGVKSEKVDTWSMEFAEDLLKPYYEDIKAFRNNQLVVDDLESGVTFL